MSFAPQHFTVWSEIPVGDIDRAIAFYNAVFQVDLHKDESGHNPMAFFPTEGNQGIGGHLYPGKPAGDGRGPTIHFAVPDSLEATAQRWKQAGGQVLTDPIAIPAGRFLYCLDPDGNSIGLYSA